MIRTDEAALCCGCAACAQVCPSGCIRLAPDGDGFLRAQADAARCSHCGACERVCPMRAEQAEPGCRKTLYAAYAREEQVRFSGASGGIFPLLAQQVISRGGAVFGAAFDGELRLKCTCASQTQALAPLYKSKYLQSDMRGAYPALRQLLSEGKTVLFTGTPCQVAALRRMFPNEGGRLLLVDFLCHGVASQAFFDRCRAYVEQRERLRVLDYQFRAKKKRGATAHYYRLTYRKRGKVRSKLRLYTASPFYLAFEKRLSLRESCYHCPFAGAVRASDLTIGDFHTVQRYLKGIDRFAGVSLVSVNTETGRRLWEQICARTHNWQLDFSELYARGELMAGATAKPKRHGAFLAALRAQPTQQVVKKFLNPRAQCCKAVYYHMPRVVRAAIKKAARIRD